MTFEEHHSRVILNIQQQLAALEDDSGPIPRGAVIGSLLAIAAAVARNPRFEDEKAWGKNQFIKLATRAFVTAQKVVVQGGNN